ncbi:hypothetical protein RB200_06780 [Streptomyces sp. PmtG]
MRYAAEAGQDASPERAAVLDRLDMLLAEQTVVHESGWRVSDLTRGRTGRDGDTGEPFQELVESGLSVVDGGLFVVGQRDAGEHSAEGFPSLPAAGL